jgi:hypothetical protein
VNKNEVVVVDNSSFGSEPSLSRFSSISSGKFIFATHGIPKKELNDWVVKLAEKSGQDIAWFGIGPMYVIGVSPIGDMDLVKWAITELMDEHNQLYIESMQREHGYTPLDNELPGYFIS